MKKPYIKWMPIDSDIDRELIFSEFVVIHVKDNKKPRFRGKPIIKDGYLYLSDISYYIQNGGDMTDEEFNLYPRTSLSDVGDKLLAWKFWLDYDPKSEGILKVKDSISYE